MKHDLQQTAEFLRQHRKVLIATHLGPDGDAVGALAGLGNICINLGQEVRLYCQSSIPYELAWLPLPAKLVHSLADLGEWTPDLVACVDCAAPYRAGREPEALFKGERPDGWRKFNTLNIDHHSDNPCFADVNLVEGAAGASTELIGDLAEALGFELSGGLGEAVYLGLVSDTGNFAYSSTSPKILRMAAKIMELGLKVEEFTQKNDNNWSLNRMHLWGELLCDLKTHADGRIVSTLITSALLKKHNTPSSDLEGFVSFIRHLRGVQVSLLTREKPSRGSKISLRSMGGDKSVDVQKVAGPLGGGGHRSASGIEMDVPPEDAEKMVLDRLLQEMRGMDEAGKN